MTPLLKKLEEKSLINLTRSADNDRQKIIVVTEAGKKLAKKSIKATEEAFCATGLTLEEAHKLIAACNKIGLPT